jgi:hemerythrin-like domain-containing protein
MDAIKLLKEDHKKVKKLLSQLEKTTERGITTRVKLLTEIEQEINMHVTIEEELFYPAFRDAAEKRDDRILFFEAREEHDVAAEELTSLKEADPSTQVFSAKAKVLKELIEHHIEEEEQDMFPRAKKLLEVSHLALLGERMETRKREMQRQEFSSARISAEAAYRR